MLPLIGAVAGLLSLTSLSQAFPQPQWEQGGQQLSATGAASATASPSSTIASALETASLAAAATGTTACNNSPDLCNRNYNNITHLGAHDAAFLRDGASSFSVAGNQFYNATIALSAGLRLLQAQVHDLNGKLELCHTSCSLLDGGSLESWLADIKYWMDNNPDEVVTLLLVNSDSNGTDSFGTAFSNSGIGEYGYTPTSSDAAISTWPTLSALVAAKTRLISFVTNINYTTSYPYLLPEFTYVFETAFSVTSLSDFDCDLSRPSSESSASTALSAGYMGLINHFADTASTGILDFTTPDITDIGTTNSPSMTTLGALGQHGANCTSNWGKKPTFLLVDFWNVGPAIKTADNLNGIVATGRTNVSTAVLESSSSAASLGVGTIWGSWGVMAVAAGAVLVVNAAGL
ncbi:MAG: hypothetical protein M1818_003715 [Claussenomyces sp. TS43310]|nr:MAG: hypothetical protein M1818_003715 [Claussenomyces sp. TS43310]